MSNYDVPEAARTNEHWGRTLVAAADVVIEAAVIEAEDGDHYAFECSDNYRYARLNNALEVESYNRQSAQGCCGSFDVELEADGVPFLFGFNYGH